MAEAVADGELLSHWVAAMKRTSRKATNRGTALAAYAKLPHLYDELVDARGRIRDQWDGFLQVLDGLSPAEFARRRAQAATIIEENGVTYNVYGDPQGLTRPWSMDLAPQILAPADWQAIEKGMQQRAALLSLILSDLYGVQTLLREKRVPPEFVYANPAFLRPCHGLIEPANGLLHLYSADMTRGPNGVWAIIADRTQAPSGAGYALENRIVMSRVFPSIIHDCRVRRLASFFDRMRNSLRALAPKRRDNPHIVLLTPGPFNETYFEHSYLARYLGFTLVEGEDLTVRDNCVFLKTLEGLERVDVILRRLDDHYCDPLELHSESTIGLVGLIQAVHSGNVAVANALGSGLLEAPALRALLPDLCGHLLAEDLVLPSVQTWWCALPAHLEHVRAHFDELVVEPAFPSPRWEAVQVAALARAERDTLLARLEAKPYAYVAREPLAASTVPVWTGTGWEPRYTVFRAHTASVGGGEFLVMPGGLTRYSESQGVLALSMQRGGGSKDTWVLSEGPPDTTSLLPAPGQPIEIRRTVTNLPSRAADNLYWLGRYLERAEGTVRRIRCVLGRLTGEGDVAGRIELSGVARLLNDATPPGAGESGPRDRASMEAQVRASIIDAESAGSVQATFSALHRVAWAVRDRLSADAWRTLNRLAEDLSDNVCDGQLPPFGELLLLLNQFMSGLAAFSGLTLENMTRGQGYRFLDMGRRIERSIHTLALLRDGLVRSGEMEAALLQALLEICDSTLTYRSRYGANLQTPAVLDLLLTDDSNPRSIMFQIEALKEHVSHMPREKAYPFMSAEQQGILLVESGLRTLDIYDICVPGDDGVRDRLDTLLVNLGECFPDISDALARHYFSHTGTPQQIATKPRSVSP
ncbi:MAG: circularly permuted type 2 ATP-grasp protein [Candidatus Hydrogenedentes bacterium]|nr:circularly permuted type 2 ATP-grasp protein [Candidatus Hydrogenedentota bacterium]